MAAKSVEFEKLVLQWDEQIKAGRGVAAKKEIIKYISDPQFKKTSRRNSKVRLPLAALLRRTGQFEVAIGLLSPLVRPSERNPVPPSADEVIDYASSIIQNGGLMEGRTLLADINGDEHPLRNLFMAFSCFGEWDYSTAVPYLLKYVSHKKLNDYQRLIGEVNLFAALVASGQSEKAFEVRDSLKAQLLKTDNMLLRANCSEIEAQLYLNIQEYKAATEHLKSVGGLFHSLGEPYSLYLQKWETVLKLRKKGEQGQGIRQEIASLKALSQFALEKKFYEVARDCDLWRGHFTRDQQLLNHVYFGTPWKAYREKVVKMNPFFESQLEELVWAPSVSSSPSKGSRAARDVSSFYQRKDLPDQLVQTLLSDFYAPFTLGRLFDKLYPQEFYSPTTSLLRIQQLVLRARQKIKKEKLSIKIRVKNKRYFFECDTALTFAGVRETDVALNKSEFKVVQFIQSWLSHEKLKSKKWVGIGELSRALNVPKRTCFNLLMECLQTGKVESKGQLKSTKYRVQVMAPLKK